MQFVKRMIFIETMKFSLHASAGRGTMDAKRSGGAAHEHRQVSDISQNRGAGQLYGGGAGAELVAALLRARPQIVGARERFLPLHELV